MSIVIGLISLASEALFDDDDEEKPKFEHDTRSSDFFKLRMGDLRLDFGSGLGQVAVFL